MKYSERHLCLGSHNADERVFVAAGRLPHFLAFHLGNENLKKEAVEVYEEKRSGLPSVLERPNPRVLGKLARLAIFWLWKCLNRKEESLIEGASLLFFLFREFPGGFGSKRL